MIVTCEHCAARYKLDDEKVKGRGARITCPHCKHVFVVLAKPEGQSPEAPEPPPEVATRVAEPPVARPGEGAPAAGPPAAAPIEVKGASHELGGGRRADQLDFRKVGIATWKVRVKIGLVYDFSDTSTLRKYIQDRRVTEDDVISHDGANWVRIGAIPDLDTYFVQVYEEIEAQRGEDSEEDSEEAFGDGPTMVVGMGSLRSNISTGVFARPQPRGDAATPRPLPQPGEPAQPPGQRFADPFESLKARQRERMRANRRAPNDGQGRRANGQAPGQGAPPASRNLWLGLAAVVVVVWGGWYYLGSRSPPKTNPVDVAVAATAPSTADAQAMRQRLLKKLEEGLQQTDEQPLPRDDVGADDPILIPIVPDERAAHYGQREYPTTPEHEGSGEPVVTVAVSTAQDHILAARTAERGRDWSTAVMAYRKALELEPRNGEAKLGLGMALFNRRQAGDVEAASAQLGPLAGAGSCPAKLWQARCLRELGDEAGASGMFQAYIECNPGDAGAQRELQQLTGG